MHGASRRRAIVSDSSWPGKSAKRVFAPDVPAIHVFVRGEKQDVDARGKPGHDELPYGCASIPTRRRANQRRGLARTLSSPLRKNILISRNANHSISALSCPSE